MIEKIERYYLEINSIEDLKTKAVPSESFSIKEEDKNNFALNKFFTNKLGKNTNGLIDLFGKIKIGWIMFQIKN